MPAEKPVFFLDESATYEGSMPAFYDPSKYEWVAILEDNWPIIKEEFDAFLSGEDTLKASSLNPPYLSNPEGWQNQYFWNFLWKKHANCKRFPKTYKLLSSIPNLIFAEFTCLQPHSKVLPHIGETNVTIRGHLGIKIPAKLPTMGIEVSGEKRGWEEGKVVLFSDAHRHTVWNDSDEKRYVLVFDVLQAPYVDRKYWMCAQALSSLTIKWIDAHISFFKNLPKFLLLGIHYVISFFWWVYLPIQNRLKFLS